MILNIKLFNYKHHIDMDKKHVKNYKKIMVFININK